MRVLVYHLVYQDWKELEWTHLNHKQSICPIPVKSACIETETIDGRRQTTDDGRKTVDDELCDWTWPRNLKLSRNLRGYSLLIPDRIYNHCSKQLFTKSKQFPWKPENTYTFWFTLSMNKFFKDLVFTFRFLWLHSLYLLLPSLKLFLFLPTSSGGLYKVGLRDYSFFFRIIGGKWRGRNSYKQRY